MRWVIIVAWMTVSSTLTGFFELGTILQRKYVYNATLMGASVCDVARLIRTFKQFFYDVINHKSGRSVTRHTTHRHRHRWGQGVLSVSRGYEAK
jgi:hypothetical protein